MNHVLVTAKNYRGTRVYHQPSGNDPNQPKCMPSENRYQWVRKDPDLLPNHNECKKCSGNFEQEHRGKSVGAILEEMDPEEFPA
jgi:hypothetical protein